jgi:hypothetical protein
MSTGITYIVYGEDDYYEKAKASITSLQRYCDLPIIIFSEREDFILDGCDSFLVEPHNESENKFKLKLHLLEMPIFDQTLFVDADTKFLDNPEPLFSDDYDLAICREVDFDSDSPIMTRWFNTGFFIANRSDSYFKLIKDSLDFFEKCENGEIEKPKLFSDQWAINESIRVNFKIKIKILPQKWNVRKPLLDVIDNPSMIHSHQVSKDLTL